MSNDHKSQLSRCVHAVIDDAELGNGSTKHDQSKLNQFLILHSSRPFPLSRPFRQKAGAANGWLGLTYNSENEFSEFLVFYTVSQTWT